MNATSLTGSIVFGFVILFSSLPSMAQFNPDALLKQMQDQVKPQSNATMPNSPIARIGNGNCTAEPKELQHELNGVTLRMSEAGVRCRIPSLQLLPGPSFAVRKFKYFDCQGNCNFSYAGLPINDISAIFLEGKLVYFSGYFPDPSREIEQNQQNLRVQRGLNNTYKMSSGIRVRDRYNYIEWSDNSSKLLWKDRHIIIATDKEFDSADVALREFDQLSDVESLAKKSPVNIHKCLQSDDQPYYVALLHSIGGARVGISEAQMLCIVPTLKKVDNSQNQLARYDVQAYRCTNIKDCNFNIANSPVVSAISNFVKGQLVYYQITLASNIEGLRATGEAKAIFNLRYGDSSTDKHPTNPYAPLFRWSTARSDLFLYDSTIYIQSSDFPDTMKAIKDKSELDRQKAVDDAAAKRRVETGSTL